MNSRADRINRRMLQPIANSIALNRQEHYPDHSDFIDILRRPENRKYVVVGVLLALAGLALALTPGPNIFFWLGVALTVASPVLARWAVDAAVGLFNGVMNLFKKKSLPSVKSQSVTEVNSTLNDPLKRLGKAGQDKVVQKTSQKKDTLSPSNDEVVQPKANLVKKESVGRRFQLIASPVSSGSNKRDIEMTGRRLGKTI